MHDQVVGTRIGKEEEEGRRDKNDRTLQSQQNGSTDVSLLEQERQKWSMRQASLQQQVADAQAECR